MFSRLAIGLNDLICNEESDNSESMFGSALDAKWSESAGSSEYRIADLPRAIQDIRGER